MKEDGAIITVHRPIISICSNKKSFTVKPTSDIKQLETGVSCCARRMYSQQINHHRDLGMMIGRSAFVKVDNEHTKA